MEEIVIFARGSTPHPPAKANLFTMKANDKRLAYVLMSTNGKVTEETIKKAKARIMLKYEMSTQSVCFDNNGFSSVLVFEVYNDAAIFPYRLGYRLRKLFTTIMMKINGGHTFVKVIIEGDTDRFPMHGAFH